MKISRKKVINGFTLIELVAVIIILAILSAVAIPIIRNVVKNSKKDATISSINSVARAAKYYYYEEVILKGAEPSILTFECIENDGCYLKNGDIIDRNEKLQIDGEIPSGTITINENGDVEEVRMAKEDYLCVQRDAASTLNCMNDTISPEINFNSEIVYIPDNNINNFSDYLWNGVTITDNEETLANEEYGQITTGDLNAESGIGEYTITYYVEDKAGNQAEKERTVNVFDAVIDYSTSGAHTFKVLIPGKYKIEVWGAQGGQANNGYNSNFSSKNSYGGKGAYAFGVKELASGNILKLYVGGTGVCNNASGQAGGSNGSGGGSGGVGRSNGSTAHLICGGGASTELLIGSTRLLVAGAGGGAYYFWSTVGYTSYVSANSKNGSTGCTNCFGCPSSSCNAGGATTSSVGVIGSPHGNNTNGSGSNGGHGDYGGSGSGGGGGYYGGSGGYAGSGGSGSSYINESQFLDTFFRSGGGEQPSPSGETEIGHTGPGYARVTWMEE